MEPCSLLYSLLSASPSPSIGCSCSPPLLPAAALHPFSELQHSPLFLDCILSFRPQLMTLGEATPQEQERAAFVFLESVPWSRVAGACVVVFFFPYGSSWLVSKVAAPLGLPPVSASRLFPFSAILSSLFLIDFGTVCVCVCFFVCVRPEDIIQEGGP